MNGIDAAKKIKDAMPESKRPHFVLVTAHFNEDVEREAKGADIDAVVAKPVSQKLLQGTIAEMFGKESKRTGEHDTGRPEGFESRRGARILLVEDNAMNQQVALELLESEGFYVDVANHGREGVDRTLESAESASPYDAILMDLQMPVMDGYEATAAIRRQSELREVPIIALTAEAMTGVRENVLESGFSDYITKPFEPSELWRVLTRWIKPASREISEDNSPFIADRKIKLDHNITVPDEIDKAEALRRIGGKENLLAALLGKFVRDFAAASEDIEIALRTNQPRDAARIAHTIKGVAGTIGAKDLGDSAAELDNCLKQVLSGTRSTVDADPALMKFRAELESLVGALSSAGFDGAEASQMTRDPASQDSARPGSREEFVVILAQIKPTLKKRQPKRAREYLDQLLSRQWEGEISMNIRRLADLVKRYRFTEAMEIVENMMKTD